MKVSVIMPTYNRASTIARAIDSILKQTYNDFELLIVDDGSKDNTKEIVNQFRDQRVKYIYQDNSGACAARNVGIKKAIGKYIAFLDSDDEWDPLKLEKQILFMENTNANIIFCNYYYEKNGSKKIAITNLNKEYLNVHDLLDRNYITTGSLLVSRDILINDLFDEQMPRYQDWELVIRLSKNHNIYFQNECLLTLHFQSESISSSTSVSKKMLALERMYEKNKNLYDSNKKAYAHLNWSIGLYSLCLNETNYNALRIGTFGNGINLKRFFIYILIRIGFKKTICKKYLKNH